jgi:hypothetical protein
MDSSRFHTWSVAASHRILAQPWPMLSFVVSSQIYTLVGFRSHQVLALGGC